MKDKIEYIDRQIETQKKLGYDYVVELLENIKESLVKDDKDLMISVLWDLVDFIIIC